MTTDGAAAMREWIFDLPVHLRQALDRCAETAWPGSESNTRAGAPGSILLAGMGGSAMACQLARSILWNELSVPCQVLQDPEVPGWVGPGTLACVVSYSGETWEALRMLDVCLGRGADVCAVARGGSLLAHPGLAESKRFALPSGFAPRAAVGWMLIPVLLAAAGSAASRLLEELRGAIETMEEEIGLWARGASLPGRDPRALAHEIAERLVFILAPHERLRPAAVRWKNQLLENGKQMAVESTFPELAHNEIMGWPHVLASVRPVFLCLEDVPFREGIRGRMAEAALRQWTGAGGALVRVPENGRSFCARILTHLALADLVSVEVARLRKIDPLPVEALERVKVEGAREAGA